MGSTVIVPVVIAALGSMVAYKFAFQEASLFVCLVIGFVAGVFVLGIETMVNASLAPGKSFSEKLKPALMRLVVSLLISATLAMPLKLFVFSGPLRAELVMMHHEQLQAIAARAQENLQQLATGVADKELRVQRQADVCDLLLANFYEEVNNRVGGRVPGNGPVARQKYADYKACDLRLLVAQDELRELRVAFSQEEISVLTDASKLQDKLSESQGSDLMSQLQAWRRLSEKNRLFSLYGLLVLGLLTVLDLLPTLVKVTTQVPTYRVVEARELLHAKLLQEAERSAMSSEVALKADSRVANEAARQQVMNRRRSARLKAALADVVYAEMMQMDRKMARHSIYDDPEFKASLERFTEEWLDIQVDHENKNNNADRAHVDDRSTARSGDHIDIAPEQRCNVGRRAPCRPPVSGYQKDIIID